MKKIALPSAFSSVSPVTIIKRITVKAVSVLILLLLQILPGRAQQVIGSFPEIEGGFENATTATRSSTAVATGVQLTSWTGANTSSVPAINTTIVRTGARSLQWTTSSTSHVLFSKTANSAAIANNTSYVIQYYWWKGYSGSARSFTPSIGPDGTAAGLVTGSATTLGVNATSFEWTKQVSVITTGSSAATPRYGLVRYSFSGGSFGTSPGYLFDDFCIYPGSAADITAPGDVTSPVISAYSSTSLTPGWTAPAGGVDGGGYVVLRYTSNPVSEPSPNANGIYAVGNTIGTGTVAYIGTNTSFVDGGLTANTAYYYKVYAVDKAFNYSSDPTVFAGFTGIAGPTAVTFTTPSTCVTDRVTISWNGPLNYNSSNNTLLGFLKAGAAVTTGTPTSALSAYTASAVFGTGTAYENDAAAYCIINGDGTSSAGDHSGLTITGLTPGTTYHLLLFNVVNISTAYSAGTTGNGTTLNSLAEPANNPAGFAKGAVTTSNIPLTWAAAGGSPAPTGYLIQASNSAVPADPADFTDPADQTNIGGGAANVKTAGTGYSSFTGFTAGTMYYFSINSYTNSNSCINFKAAGPAINVATLPNLVTSQLLSITGGTGTISWSAAAGYSNTNHTTLVFVSSSPITTGTPTANPSGYTASTAFGAGTPFQLDANARCVYSGDGTSVNVTGLASGNTYYVLILTVVDAANYDATHSYSAYATTSTTYNSSLEYTWDGSSSTDWQVATNWTPDRNTVTAADVLIFNTPGAVTATNVPTQTIAKLSVNAGTVTLQAAAASTLTITHTGPASTDFTIAGGAALTLSTNVSVTLGSSTTASIVGTLNVNSGNTYNSNGTSVVTTVAGTINNYGVVTSTTAAKFVVNGGGTYNHGINGGTIPTGTWNTNSTCLITGTTSTQNFSGHRQTFSKFIWDCPNQSNTHFVLGENSSSTAPTMIVTDSLIVKRTNGRILQLSSTGGQRDFVCGNFFQYGGLVAITYNTDASGEQRSLTVNNTFYVTDSLESNTRFQIINTPGGQNIIGRLFVGGNVEMHPTIAASILERVIGGAAALAEIWFTGSAPQYARFHTISGNVDFVNNHTGTGVTLLSDVTANSFKLIRGTFFIASNTLTIKNAVTYPAPGTGTFGGSSTSNLILNGITGTLNFYTGYRTLKDFTLTAGATASLGTELGITAGTSPGRDSLGVGAVLTTNDNLVLRSDINGTARQAQVPVDGSGVALATIIGKVGVERYLPMGLNYDSRRWRLITAPFKAATAPTIQEAWQQGTFCPDRNNPSAYDPKPGYGTHITVANVAINGFDQGSQNNPSIFHYSKATASNWKAPSSSTGIKVTDSLGVYMLFVRGDRSIVIVNQFVAAKPTTLDPKGELYLGNVSIPMDATGARPVGNPYASQIKLDNVDFAGTPGYNKTVYLWDPKALGSSGVGGFVTCTGDGTPGSYTYTGNSSNYGAVPGVIESSGAFMVGPGSGNIIFHESDKTIASSTIGVASRPGSNNQKNGALGVISKLYVDLVGTRNGEPSLADGIAVAYNRHYRNSIDAMDAPKLLTFNTRERISIQKEEGLYAVERRNGIRESDTIQLVLSRLNRATYQFNIRPTDFDAAYTAFLEDNFTNAKQPVSLAENTSFSFDITDDSLSFAPNRFYITFKRNKKQLSETSNGITVFPNPVRDGILNVQMNSMPAGNYIARLMNNSGQVVFTKRIAHQKTAAVEVLHVPGKTARGIYQLEIVTPDNRVITQGILLQ